MAEHAQLLSERLASALRKQRAGLMVCLLLLAWALAAVLLLPRSSAPDISELPSRPSAPDAADQDLSRTSAAKAGPQVAPAAQPDVLAGLRSRWQRSSLRGAALDGELSFDAEGRLQIAAGLRHRFEHYLALIGEFSLDELKTLLLDDVRRAHGEAAVAAVQSAFERYLGLRQASSSLPPGLSLSERLTALQALRRQWFGDQAEALFGDEADYDAYTLQRLHLEALPAEQRAAALAELERQRPPAELHARQQAQSALLAEEQSRQFDALGLDATARAAEREALWGSEAALRLDALDRERAAWEQRLQRYAEQRARLLGDPRLDEAARREALTTLLNRSFLGPERVRVDSLQAAGLLPKGS